MATDAYSVVGIQGQTQCISFGKVIHPYYRMILETSYQAVGSAIIFSTMGWRLSYTMITRGR